MTYKLSFSFSIFVAASAGADGAWKPDTTSGRQPRTTNIASKTPRFIAHLLSRRRKVYHLPIRRKDAVRFTRFIRSCHHIQYISACACSSRHCREVRYDETGYAQGNGDVSRLGKSPRARFHERNAGNHHNELGNRIGKSCRSSEKRLESNDTETR